ncbi:hypothetical protein [Bradyrhizobium sp. STM 3557]|uniref:hypothetical protein n=1 Tax=Bradyrhizobium sp. STM 3557 TaxID=578920 RepID=UPI00388E961C
MTQVNTSKAGSGIFQCRLVNGDGQVRAEQHAFYLNWAKERIDEMDAALTSFEIKADEAKA